MKQNLKADAATAQTTAMKEKQQFVEEVVKLYCKIYRETYYDYFKKFQLAINDLTMISENSIYCYFVEELLLCKMDGGDVDSKIQNLLDRDCINNPQGYYEMFFSLVHLGCLFRDFNEDKKTFTKWADKLTKDDYFSEQYITFDESDSLSKFLYLLEICEA